MGNLNALPFPAAAVVPVGAVPEGKIVDFLTGNAVNDTPEEYVRQNLEKALVRQYKYAAADCSPEFPIKVGSARKRIDIAVFKPEGEHRQANIYLILETKKAGTSPRDRNDGIGQLQSYMAASANAQFGVWTNGDERFCYAKRVVGGVIAFEEIVDIPSAGQLEAEAQRPKRKELMPAAADNLLFAFRRCHNYIAGTEGMQKQAAFWELLKLIFCKIEDERTGGSILQFYTTSTELSSGTAAGVAKSRIQKVFTDKVVRKYPDIFAGPDREINLKPNVVAYVVSQLQRFSLLFSPVDVKGVAYEEIVGSNLRGDRGEFFTPRNACRMAVTMLAPQPTERLLDPACGTGGFLIIAMNHALQQVEALERAQWTNPEQGGDSEREELYRKRSEYLSTKVFGYDLNPALVRAAKMNMVMNNDGEGGLFQANSLAHPHTWSPDASAKVQLGSIDILFTNPPFGANIIIDDRDVLNQYELAAVWDLTGGAWKMRVDQEGQKALQKSLPPEILFIERCVQFLVEGRGRMAMVIPNGILNNPALGYVRQWLLRNTQIIAVVDMARELFQPKNDTQTSMIIMRRLSHEERQIATAGRLDYPLFMAVTHKVGRDKRGSVIFKHTETGEDVVVLRPEQITEIDPQTGDEVAKTVQVRDRVVDDELPEVAAAFRSWVAQQNQ